MTAADLTALLRDIDDDFVPPLSSRTDLSAYAAKLLTHATVITLYEQQKLSAFAAIYCNDPVGETAYLTMIAVGKEFRGRGTARNMLETCVRYLKSRDFKSLKLEVYKTNTAALGLYDAFGFAPVEETESSLFLAVNIV